jgi:hypothetical protein
VNWAISNIRNLSNVLLEVTEHLTVKLLLSTGAIREFLELRNDKEQKIKNELCVASFMPYREWTEPNHDL